MIRNSRKNHLNSLIIGVICLLLGVSTSGVIPNFGWFSSDKGNYVLNDGSSELDVVKSAATKPILFDQVHNPEYDSVDPDFKWFFDQYGSQVEAMVTGDLNPIKLSQYTSVYLANPYTEFEDYELDALMEYMKDGGKIFLVGGWVFDATNYLGAGSRQLLTHMGFNYYSGELTDTDDYEGITARVVLNESNIIASDLTENVETVFYTRGGVLTSVPFGTKVILQSDTDGTATPSGYPLMTLNSFGKGELVVMMDAGFLSNASLPTSLGTIPIRSYGDNPQLMENILNWMTTPVASKPCLIDGSNGVYSSTFQYTFTNYPVSTAYVRDIAEEWRDFCHYNPFYDLSLDFLEQYQCVVLANGYINYTAQEKYALLQYMENGGKILALGEQKPYTGNSVQTFLEQLGFEWEPSILTDADDYIDATHLVVLQEDNFASHPLLTGVNNITYWYAGAFASVPTDFEVLIHTDDDSTVNYQNKACMGILPYGYGSLLVFLDNGIFLAYNHTIDGEPRIHGFHLDNEVLRQNIYEWMQESTHTLSNPTLIRPNGGETISGSYTINWTAAVDSYEETVVYNLYIKSGNGTYTLFAPAVSGTTYSFDSTLFSDGSSYMIKVEAISGDLTSEDESDAVFIIHNTPPEPSFTEKFLNSFKDSSNWYGMGAVALVGLALGGLIFGLAGKRKK